jgi:hypothetical protein
MHNPDKVSTMALAIALRDVLDCIGAPDQWQAIRRARQTLARVTGDYADKASPARRLAFMNTTAAHRRAPP